MTARQWSLWDRLELTVIVGTLAIVIIAILTAPNDDFPQGSSKEWFDPGYRNWRNSGNQLPDFWLVGPRRYTTRDLMGRNI